MHRLLCATAMICVAVSAAAQSHETATPAKKDAPTDAHAPAARPATAAAEHAAPAAAKAGGGRSGPVVSRITAAPAPAAKAGDAAAASDHAPVAKGKSKPLVSGAKGAAHEAEVPAGPRVSGSSAARPPAAAAPLPSEHAAPAAHNEHPAGAAPATKPTAPRVAGNPKAPVKLSTVHGRITAALAEFRAESGDDAKAGGDGDGHGDARGGAARDRSMLPPKPRFVVSWPAVRWHVSWRDDLDRLIVSWPE